MGFSLIFLLKSKIASTVIDPWFTQHQRPKTSTITPSIVIGPPLRWRQYKPWDISGDYWPCEYGSSAASDGHGLLRGWSQAKIAFVGVIHITITITVNQPLGRGHRELLVALPRADSETTNAIRKADGRTSKTQWYSNQPVGRRNNTLIRVQRERR